MISAINTNYTLYRKISMQIEKDCNYYAYKKTQNVELYMCFKYKNKSLCKIIYGYTNYNNIRLKCISNTKTKYILIYMFSIYIWSKIF